ncbi:hypothetical protein DBR06_SOUSAS810179, partial [Sousa chinensis]
SHCGLKQIEAAAEGDAVPVLQGQASEQLTHRHDKGSRHMSASVALCAQGKEEGNCKTLKYPFFKCKRSILYPKSRFRGRKGC